MTALVPDYSLAEVAQALGMSERWVRRQIAEGAAHQRYGHKIRFTAEQVQALREKHSENVIPVEAVTTRRGRRAS